MESIKKWIAGTPLYWPVKFLAAMLGKSTYPLQYHRIIEAEPYLKRAIARLGSVHDKDKNDALFYSYFTEMWADGYELHLARQHEAYLPLLRIASGKPFLDIGCGAGEFVSFLGDHGFNAQGIDLNEKEVARAIERGLNVRCGDASIHLAEKIGEFSGISLLQVIEHFPPDKIQSFIAAIYEALEPGGQVLIETINTRHPLSFHTFYMDVTHTRPMPSDLLVFMLQWAGFIEVKIIYTTPIVDTLRQRADPTASYFNYAVLGKKPDLPSR